MQNFEYINGPNGLLPVIDQWEHRSGVETYQDCPRSYFLTYGQAGCGIVRVPYPNYFDIGSAVHIGLAASMEQKNVEQACYAAVDYYLKQPSYPARSVEERVESELLIEALTRVWYRNGHNQFHNAYKVLFVEAGVHIPQLVYDSEMNCYVRINWLSRPDAIVQERGTPIKAGISWKTIDSATEYRRSYFHHDLQGLLESHFGTIFLNSPDASWTAEQLAAVADTQTTNSVDYIQTIFLQKGKRESYDLNAPNSGSVDPEAQAVDEARNFGQFRRLETFLLYPYTLTSSSNEVPFWNELPDLIPNCAWNYRYNKPGNTSYNTLGRSFKRSSISKTSLAAWIDNLVSNRVFPTPEYNYGQCALDQVVVWEEPTPRVDQQALTAVRQTYFKALARAKARALANTYNSSPENFELYLDQFWPQHRKHCKTPVWCQFMQLCYQNNVKSFDEIPEGFAKRMPHHEAEKASLLMRGLL